MKRSEAILAIAECLVEPHNEDAFKEASYILKKLENLGLEPPPYQAEQGTGYSDEYGFEETYSIWVNGWEWEPEDEPK